MSAFDKIGPGTEAPGTINVIVEIPTGSQNKYEIDHETGLLHLDRVLFSPIHYPGDYGFIPGTLGEDGDPLDALVIVSFPTYPGTVIHARPVGMLDMIDSGQPDAKVLCVPVHDIRLAGIQDIGDIAEPIRNEIAHFFTTYKHLEGKEVNVKGWKDALAARKEIEKAIKAAR